MFRPTSRFTVNFLVFYTFLLLCAGFVRGETEGLYPPDIRKIKDRGRIIVAQYGGIQKGFFDYAPEGASLSEPVYLYKGRRVIGVDIALAFQIATELDVKLELDRSPLDFDAVCKYVAMGKCDLGISKLSATVKRAQYVRFTDPYAILRTCLLVDRLFEIQSKRHGGVVAYCQHNVVRIGVWKRSALSDYVRQLFPKCQAVPYDDFGDQVKALLDGEVHFVLDDELEVVQHLKAHPELSVRLQMVAIPHQLDPIAVAVSPKSPNLLALLNLLIQYGGIQERVKRILKVE